ncbi:uncharacterized protein CDV56_109478 [Aspergillus thermomutatus]|uniref:NAD-dependent epimerase/dehydratase domain-containing protein n=1 Tax=Aspergillus thermomutatus TaxID=41047 RepID=A0A397HY96_ASPTH|nr:uncharacterized protein CDV56_109478 [Aspergillus thermomutatus]RHZ65540.1 hypothetical protein CDV56_109478 [Aspergillus thermomutatus]
MTRVLLTGSGFIAAHILDTLLAHGHSVVTTVRSQQKAIAIQQAHPQVPRIGSTLPLSKTSSSQEHSIMLLSLIPRLKLSFTPPVPITFTQKMRRRNFWNQADWSPITESQAHESPANGYRASKTFAVGTSCLDVHGTGETILHTLRHQSPASPRPHFFTVSSHFSNKEIAEIIREEFPQFNDCLPTGEALVPGDYPPDGVYGFDNSRMRQILGAWFQSLRESVVDVVRSLLERGVEDV